MLTDKDIKILPQDYITILGFYLYLNSDRRRKNFGSGTEGQLTSLLYEMMRSQ